MKAKLYFIVMTLDSYMARRNYVYTENDVENGGSVDGDGFQFESKDEAEKTKKELESYASEKGYENLKFFIEELEVENDDDDTQSIRKMYEDFNNMQHNAFYELYSEEDWEYCNTHTLEQAIIERR